jgi:YVTN family beta-propeller protein
MKRLRLLAVAAASAIACRESELIAPNDHSMATGPHAMSASAPSGEKFAAYISDATTNSVLVVGQTSHDTITVIPLGSPPGASASSPDGARVYVVLGSLEQLAVIRTSDNTVLAKIPLFGSGASGVVVSPDNRTVYVANRSGTISVVDATALKLLPAIPVTGISPFMLDITPDGSHLYVGDDAAYYLGIVNTGSRVVEGFFAVGFRPWGVNVSSDGQFVYVATRDGAVSRYVPSIQDVDISYGFPGTPMGLAVTPDNQRLFVAVHDRGLVRVLNVATGQWALVNVANAAVPKITSDGRWVYVTQPESNQITVLDAQTSAISATFRVTNPSGVSFASATAPTQPTATTITSSPQPSINGQTVQFTATVSSNGAPVTTGNLTFRVGGTACSDATTFAGPVSLDASGKATASRTFNASGSPFVVRACYEGTTGSPQFLASEGAVTQTVNPAPTATVITSSPQPSVTGQSVQFTATVTSGASPVTIGQLTFRLGGTACLDAVTFSGPASLDASGKATASRAFNASGSPFTVRACYDGTTSGSQFQSSQGAVTQTVNPAPVNLTTAVSPSAQQYSDQLVLSAQLALAGGALNGQTLTGVVTFSLGGVQVGTASVSSTTLPATVTLSPSYTVGVPAGSYPVTAVFTSSNSNFVSGSVTGANVTITAEDAAVALDPGFPTEAKVTAPFGSSGPITFAFTVSETSPETNADQTLARPGDLTRTAARAVLTPSNNGAPITVACTGGSVSGSGYGQTRPFTCATSGLQPDNYQVSLQVIATSGGSYYAGSRASALRVFDPSAEAAELERAIMALVKLGLMKHGNGNALCSKLDEVLAKIARGDNQAAINQLGAFVNQVEALHLPAVIGDQLIAAAQAISADVAK